MNIDGASHGNPGPATAGGVIRGGNGEWLGGFALHFGFVQLRWRNCGECIMGYSWPGIEA